VADPPAARRADPGAIPVGGRVLFLPDEPRVLLAAVLDTPEGPVTAATTHLSFVPGWNVRQFAAGRQGDGSAARAAGSCSVT
jgi:hypothetical protein